MTEKMVNRVPHIVMLYWFIKIASTTLGETGADMFSMTFDLGYGVTFIIFMAVFILLVGFKLSLARYESISYWFTFTASAIVGTVISDYIDRTLELGYAIGSLLLLGLLAVVLVIWKVSEKTINVELITTSRAETYYWTAFLIANTLGTAAGDFLADDLKLGFISSAALISVALLTTVFLHFFSHVSSVVLFWVAFVLTRPFGATFGDFLTKPIAEGGLNLGTMVASAFFSLALVIAVVKEAQLERLRAKASLR